MPRKDKTRGPSQRAFGGNRKTHSYSDESFNALELSKILPALFCVILACAVYTPVSALTRVAQNSRWPCPSHPLFAGFFQCRLSFCQWPLLTSDRSLHSQRVTLCLIISGSVVSRSLSWKFVSSGFPNTWSSEFLECKSWKFKIRLVGLGPRQGTFCENWPVPPPHHRSRTDSQSKSISEKRNTVWYYIY